MAATNEVTGMNHAKIPGTMFDNSSFRCIGFTVTKDKLRLEKLFVSLSMPTVTSDTPALSKEKTARP